MNTARLNNKSKEKGSVVATGKVPAKSSVALNEYVPGLVTPGAPRSQFAVAPPKQETVSHYFCNLYPFFRKSQKRSRSRNQLQKLRQTSN